jgi:hypothetical protein
VREVRAMGTELETRRNDRGSLFQLYRVRDGKEPLSSAISSLQAKMEPEDVKLVKQEYEEWAKGQNETR